MREILFRGKQENNEWAEGSLIIWGDGSCSIESGSLTEPMKSVDPETVGQFTGLTDKNGKKIFEGDVVVNDYGEIKQIEYFQDNWFAFCFFSEKCGIEHLFEYDDIEIIGNIHDNPELLENP